MKIMTRVTSVLLLSIVCSAQAVAADAEDLEAMLHSFLAGAGTKAAHSLFWAEDLVYTSSDGSRFDKSVIMAGFEDADVSDETPSMAYSAADIDIRIYGDTAIVAFKLVATPAEDAVNATVLHYFNTGTFLKRNENWKVIAWQATRIPPP